MKTIRELRKQIRVAERAGAIEAVVFLPEAISFRLVRDAATAQQGHWFTRHRAQDVVRRLEEFLLRNFPEIRSVAHLSESVVEILHYRHEVEL